MTVKADHKFQVDEELKALDEAHEAAVKAKRSYPHPYPKPREILSARLAQNPGEAPAIRALIRCGDDGIGGDRILEVAPDKYTPTAKAKGDAKAAAAKGDAKGDA